MSITLGKKIFELRKQKGITQDEMSEKLGVSPQAVSKWENDISCPDIMLLPMIAEMFHVTIDELLGNESKNKVCVLPKEQRKNFDDMLLRILVNSSDGDKVRVNLPMPLIKMALQMGIQMPQISSNDALKGIDLQQLLSMVENGIIGKLVEIESADGDKVEIVVE
ncbi:MAG: helix-turn-helix transcriptional regulator [Clostridia bacterium]